jgi:hypothetical protein
MLYIVTLCRYFFGGIEIIAIRDLVFSLKSAFDAAMENNIFLTFFLSGDGFHKAPAHFSAIAGEYIDMFAPETLRAMIGVSVPSDSNPALFAGKIFSGALKFLALHFSQPPFYV